MIAQLRSFNCVTDYALESLSIPVEPFIPFFDRLPLDPYIKDKYRSRRLSRFRIEGDRVVQLAHGRLLQSKSYNPLLGDVVREFSELEPELVQHPEFHRLVLEFYEFCKICSIHTDVDVHQIRTIASPTSSGHPAPEGIHRDGVDLIGIFCVQRRAIAGGKTQLYRSPKGEPFFDKILDPGQFLVFDDRHAFHFTSLIQATTEEPGVRDVFVCTCPGLSPPD